MNKEKVRWCCEQKRGIELIEPKEHLAKKYLEEAEESLKVCMKLNGNWKVISAYYACYNAFYSLLMKCGIKCEIHDCTIELIDFFDFSEKEKEFMKELKKKRINSQYYLKKEEIKNEKEVKEFVLKCKELSSYLNKDKINEIRKEIEGLK